MPALKLFLLGTPRVELDGISVDIRRRRGLALLAYLAVAGEKQSRDSLAAVFWPESGHQRARASLRRDLSELNLALAGQWLVTDRESADLRKGYRLDVTEFRRLLAPEEAGVDDLESGVELYQDDFLSGFTLPDCPQFDEWQFYQGESLRQSLASALERLVEILSDRHSYERAIHYARRRLALDPLHEPTHHQLMRLHAQAGQQSAALRQYEIVRQSLDEEFGVAPSAETTALYEAIRAGKLRPPMDAAPTQPQHNLPVQTTTFVGRNAELTEIRNSLLDKPNCRLLNLVGPGGIGKTRLALAAAAQMSDSFPDGGYFVSLAPVGENVYIVPAIAEALRFSLFGNMDPREQLLDYLSQKKLLLVVDNFEHLLEEAGLLSQIVERAPSVAILATSRERLNLLEEWVYDVHGLAFPTDDEEAWEDIREYSAVELFIQRARQTVAEFSPDAEEMADIVHICRLVEGMPLGLELAAPWIRTLSCREIAEEIERSLDFLTTPLRNVQERHRSITVVFEQTWRRLPPPEREAMQRLSVFRGGSTRLAAEEVAGATLSVLSSLRDKALLRRTNTGRYEVHELVRQFAEAQLQMDREADDRARRRHRDFYVSFLEARTAGVKGHGQTEALAEIEEDMDNVRLAWRGAVSARDAAAIQRSAECLFVYYLYRNGYDEGILEFGRAFAAYAAIPVDERDVDDWALQLAVPDQEVELAGFLLASLGYFVAHRRDLRRGQKLQEAALALLRRATPRNRWNMAFALHWLGWGRYFQGRITEGNKLARQSLAILAENADPWVEGWATVLLANSLSWYAPAEAEDIYEAGLALCRESGDQAVLSYMSYNRGTSLILLGRYAQAQRHIDLGVAISERLNNSLGLGYALQKRGQLGIAQGDYRRAVQSLQKSWFCFNKVGTVHASRSQYYLGMAHHLQGHFELAGQLYAQALAGLKVAKSTLELPLCLNGLGWLAYDQGKLDEAERLHRESLSLLQDTEPGSWLVAVTRHHLARVMIAYGKDRHVEASDHLRRALELAAERQLAPLALNVCLDAAQYLTQVNEMDRAVELLALAAQHDAGTFDTRTRARRHLTRLREQLPLETIRTVQERMKTADLWAMARTLMAQLAAERR